MSQISQTKLTPLWQKRYKIAKFFVYFVFAVAFFFGVYRILFPSARFGFFFRTPDASKNTVTEPRTENGTLVKNGKISKNQTLIFDTQPLGDFSEVKIEFILEKKSAKITKGKISARKSFRSFFYPEGNTIDSFEKTTVEPIELFSSNESVFLASQEKIWPIADVPTFESMGFIWNDVVPASSEEISFYEKQKLLTLKTPHPDGTIFSEKESGNYYLIEEGKKKRVENVSGISSYAKTNPIAVEEKSLETKNECLIEKSSTIFRKYSCSMSTEKLGYFSGNDYQFETNFGEDVNIKEIKVTFRKTVNVKNLTSSLTTLKNRLIGNYGNNK